jgi:hypothetical protein
VWQNPEFRRNLWLELTPHRLVAMPLILGALLALLLVLSDGPAAEPAAALSAMAFGVLVLLWGGKLAAGSVLDEAAGRTWDGQRLSALTPGELLWGKVLGSTAYVWYGGLICLGVHLVAARAADPPLSAWRTLAALLLGACFCHCASVLLALHTLRQHAVPVGRSSGVFLLPLLVAYGYFQAFFSALGNAAVKATWFGHVVPLRDFLLVSLALFAGWAAVGAWRLMREELQVPNAPAAWLGFVSFLMVYVAGFVAGQTLPTSPGERGAGTIPLAWLAAFFVAVALVYLTALTEPKDPVVFRRAIAQRHALGPGRLLTLLPRWAVTVPLALLAGLAAAVAPYLAPAGAGGRARPALLAAAVLCFLARDLGLLLFFHFGSRPKRADAATLLYCGLLYGVAPALLHPAFGDAVYPYFFPTWLGPAAVLPGAAQALLVAALLVRRWRRRYGGGAAPPVLDAPGTEEKRAA